MIGGAISGLDGSPLDSTAFNRGLGGDALFLFDSSEEEVLTGPGFDDSM